MSQFIKMEQTQSTSQNKTAMVEKCLNKIGRYSKYIEQVDKIILEHREAIDRAREFREMLANKVFQQQEMINEAFNVKGQQSLTQRSAPSTSTESTISDLKKEEEKRLRSARNRRFRLKQKEKKEAEKKMLQDENDD